MADERHWKTALITGAASGIGKCFAETLSQRGTACGLVDVSAASLQAVAAALREGGAKVEARVADVSDAAAVSDVVAQLGDALGGIELVIHCAAILGPGRFDSQSHDEFERVVRIDLLGTANVVRAALPALRQSRGAVACLASTAGVHGWPEMSAYSAAKFGVAGFCDAVRPELRLGGVHISAVFPLLIDTPLLRGADAAPILKAGRAISPQKVVDKTLAGVAAGKARIYIPGTVRLIAAAQGLMPSVLDWYGRKVGLK
jgi:3-oxoacyl-[acyl-carrier protein] reductase